MKRIFLFFLLLSTALSAVDFLDRYQIFGPIYEKGFNKMDMAEKYYDAKNISDAIVLFEGAIVLLEEAKKYRANEQINKIRALGLIADDRIIKAAGILHKYYLEKKLLKKAKYYQEKSHK